MLNSPPFDDFEPPVSPQLYTSPTEPLELKTDAVPITFIAQPLSQMDAGPQWQPEPEEVSSLAQKVDVIDDGEVCICSGHEWG